MRETGERRQRVAPQLPLGPVEDAHERVRHRAGVARELHAREQRREASNHEAPNPPGDRRDARAEEPHERREHQVEVFVDGGAERLERVEDAGDGGEIARALGVREHGDHAREEVREVLPEIVVKRGGELLAQAEHLAQERPGSPERADHVEDIVQVRPHVAADDGDERGELRQRELAKDVVALASHLQNHRHRRGEVLHAAQT